jgi:hypothetical protein
MNKITRINGPFDLTIVDNFFYFQKCKDDYCEYFTIENDELCYSINNHPKLTYLEQMVAVGRVVNVKESELEYVYQNINDTYIFRKASPYCYSTEDLYKLSSARP